MSQWLLSPPAAFIIILFCVWIMSRLFSKFAFRGKSADGGKESYACGEKDYDPMAQPDYSLFFPFAFFFTLAHVATLMVATIPKAGFGSFAMAVIYIIGAIVGLSVLLRK